MENFINLKKIEWAVQNGTNEDKADIMKQIHQLNVTAESVWLKSQLKTVLTTPLPPLFKQNNIIQCQIDLKISFKPL